MEKTKTRIDKNLCECYAVGSSGRLRSSTLYGGSKECIMAYVYHNGKMVKVYNRSEYTFTVETELELDAAAQLVDPVISSYKHDYNTSTKKFDTNRKFVNYTGDFNLDANTSGETRNGIFVVRQEGSNLMFVCSYAQAGKALIGYKFVQVENVEVSYDSIPPSGGTVQPMVTVTAWMKRVYTDKSEEDFYSSYDGVVTLASGHAEDSSGATINTKTGVVTMGERSDTGDKDKAVFYVESMSGTFTIPLLSSSQQVKSWTWNDGYAVQQMPKDEDYEVYYKDPDYVYSFVVEEDDMTIEATDEYVDISYVGKKIVYYYMASNPSNKLEREETLPLYVVVNNEVENVVVLDGKEGTGSVFIGANSSESNRILSIHVYSSDERYDETFVVTQRAVDTEEFYGVPVLNGIIELEEISCDGEAVPILVPIKQGVYRHNAVTGLDDHVRDYETTVHTVAVGGKAEPGVGFSFSNGYVSANSMGRTPYPDGRKVYTLTSVFVDGIGYPNHEIVLGSSMDIWQAENNEHTTDVYALSVSANPASGIPALGGTSTISYSARIKTETWYDADPTKITSFMDTSASLSTTIGEIVSSVSGSGTATLNINRENYGDAREAIITLSKGMDSVSCSVWQKAAEYDFVRTDDNDLECDATESKVYVSFRSTRNGKVLQPRIDVDGFVASVGEPILSETVYTFPITIFANTSSDARNIELAAVQKRWDGDFSIPLTITQAGAAASVSRTVTAYGSWNTEKTKISPIYARLNNNSGNSVTFTGISVQLRRILKKDGFRPMEAELVTTVRYNESVYLEAGESKEITLSDITHSGSEEYYYWLAAYATQTTETTYNEIEETVVYKL